MDDNRKRIKKAQVHLALHPDLMQRIRSSAAADGRTVTNWIERVINETLNKYIVKAKKDYKSSK